MNRLLSCVCLLILVSCSKTPEQKLRKFINEQNSEYESAARREIENNLPPGTLNQYEFHSTNAGFESNDEGEVFGHVYVLFEKKGTRQRRRTGPNSFSVSFDSLQVNFESFDSYKRIELMISENGKATTKEVFVEHFPQSANEAKKSE